MCVSHCLCCLMGMKLLPWKRLLTCWLQHFQVFSQNILICMSLQTLSKKCSLSIRKPQKNLLDNVQTKMLAVLITCMERYSLTSYILLSSWNINAPEDAEVHRHFVHFLEDQKTELTALIPVLIQIGKRRRLCSVSPVTRGLVWQKRYLVLCCRNVVVIMKKHRKFCHTQNWWKVSETAINRFVFIFCNF